MDLYDVFLDGPGKGTSPMTPIRVDQPPLVDKIAIVGMDKSKIRVWL